MAAATSIILGGTALAGAGLQIAQGMKQTSDAKSALENYERQELENAYKDIPISLLGSNLRREDASQTTANLTQSAQESGVRGVIGALPKIQMQNNESSRQNQIDVDNQVQKRNYAIAGDEQRVRQMQERRENADLAGIGQQLAVGQQNTMAGISGAFNGLGMMAGGIGDNNTPLPEAKSVTAEGFKSRPMTNNEAPLPTSSLMPTPGRDPFGTQKAFDEASLKRRF